MTGTWDKRRRCVALSLLAVCALGACSGGGAPRARTAGVDAAGQNHFEAYLLYRAMSGAGGPGAEAVFTEGAWVPDAAIHAPLPECSFRSVRR